MEEDDEDEFEEAKSEEGESEDESGASFYDSEEDGKKRKGKRSSGDRGRPAKRAREDPPSHASSEDNCKDPSGSSSVDSTFFRYSSYCHFKTSLRTIESIAATCHWSSFKSSSPKGKEETGFW